MDSENPSEERGASQTTWNSTGAKDSCIASE